jgi:hypothetical protein
LLGTFNIIWNVPILSALKRNALGPKELGSLSDPGTVLVSNNESALKSLFCHPQPKRGAGGIIIENVSFTRVIIGLFESL